MNQGVLSPKYYQTSSNTCNDHLDFKSEKYIVKPNSQGSSVGFNVIDNFKNLNDAIDIAYDYKSKYTAGESKYTCPADLTIEKYQFVQDCALSVHKMLKCDVYSRVDFKFYENNFHFLEINTLPGMTETSLFPMAAKRHGFSFKDIINKIIKLSLQK